MAMTNCRCLSKGSYVNVQNIYMKINFEGIIFTFRLCVMAITYMHLCTINGYFVRGKGKIKVFEVITLRKLIQIKSYCDKIQSKLYFKYYV